MAAHRRDLSFGPNTGYDLATMRWKKLIGNIPTSGLSVVLNASLQELVENVQSYDLLLKITHEVIAAANQCGANLPKNIIEQRIEVFESFKKMNTSYPSMKGDFENKKLLELHAIYENVIQIAKQHHVSMPLTEMLYQELIYLNEKNLRCHKE